VKRWVASKTNRIRHRIARCLVPALRCLLDWQCRPMICQVKEKFGDKPLIGCEIGVAEGENAQWILETLNIKKLFLVDPYQPYRDHGRYWSHYVDKEARAHQRLKKYRDKITWLRMKSMEATSHILEDLDFVYVDGNHSYSYCYDDITKFYRKLKVGGVIGGHNFQCEFPDVIRAVSHFCLENNLKYHNRKVDWWIVNGI